MRTLLFFCFFTTLFAVEPISPIPLEVEYDKKIALLGKELFSDTLLSKDNSVSCLSCHNIYESGADTREVSMGFNGELAVCRTKSSKYLTKSRFLNLGKILSFETINYAKISA